MEEFEGMKVVEVNTTRIKKLIEKRKEQGFSNASINRELAALKRAFNLAARCTPPKVALVPYIPMLKENNTRKGFVEYEEFVALRDALPDYLRKGSSLLLALSLKILNLLANVLLSTSTRQLFIPCSFCFVPK